MRDFMISRSLQMLQFQTGEAPRGFYFTSFVFPESFSPPPADHPSLYPHSYQDCVTELMFRDQIRGNILVCACPARQVLSHTIGLYVLVSLAILNAKCEFYGNCVIFSLASQMKVHLLLILKPINQPKSSDRLGCIARMTWHYVL